LATDLIKGSDIEIQLHIDDSRVLSSAVFLVMTQQEFKNVFSISENQVSLDRLREQYSLLESELTDSVAQFQMNDNITWEVRATTLLEDLRSHRSSLQKLKDGDKSDTKYIIAEKIMRISQEADKRGGNERLSSIAEQYLEVKEQVAEAINTADFDKEEMRRTLQRIEAREDSFLRSKNAFILESKLKQLQDLHWNALCNNIGFLISQYVIWRELPPESYKEPATAKSMIRMA